MISLRTPTACAVAALMIAASAQADTTRHPHLFRMTSFKSQPIVRPAGDMFYYGGSVFSSVKLVSVIWNKDVLQNTKDQVPLFSAALVNSTYLDQMKEYKTKGVEAINGRESTNQTIHRGTYIGQFQLKPHNKSLTLTDNDVQKELKRQIAEGHLPPSDLNTFYMIYFPANITIDSGGALSCRAFGAYHSATNGAKLAAHNIFYSVEPECNGGLALLTFAASHEYAEATTDNVPTPGSNPDYPQAWNDISGFEVGDVCGGRAILQSDAGQWTVTQYYLNSLHGCSVKTSYTSP